jgi:hypothetical protein
MRLQSFAIFAVTTFPKFETLEKLTSTEELNSLNNAEELIQVIINRQKSTQ